MAIAQTLTEEREVRVLAALALAFNPDRKGPRRVVIKNRTKGHGDWLRDLSIAALVDDRLKKGDGKKRAFGYVADKVGLNERRVERIYNSDALRVERILNFDGPNKRKDA
jgi:hypothetical protein